MQSGQDHHLAKLTDDYVREARKLLAAGESQTTIGRILGVHRTVISKIHLGKAWSHVK